MKEKGANCPCAAWPLITKREAPECAGNGFHCLSQHFDFVII